MGCRVLVLYWSKGGNTHKVAQTIHKTVQDRQIPSEMVEITEDLDIDVFSRELVVADRFQSVECTSNANRIQGKLRVPGLLCAITSDRMASNAAFAVQSAPILCDG